MDSPLENPLDELLDRQGNAPDWIWKGAGFGAGFAGAFLARKLLDGARWKFSARGSVPLNPADERMTWANALFWTAIVGVAGSLGRLIAQRIVAVMWTKKSGSPVSAMPVARRLLR